ncbi:MAG: hypothetical protein KatS3mg076_1241 [Candidatus Binatia bacterium]|nr:MAG: hypothetical protein KatS3mg076_1241 [Candidatus Binatia bacterium]
MALSRREFFRRAGLLAAGSVLAPRFWRNPWMPKALAQSAGERFFVVLFLDGGNDGLNTVVPLDDAIGNSTKLRSHYEAARNTGAGGLRLGQSFLSPMFLGNDPNTGTPLAFHAALSGLKNLFDRGKVAVVQGCGYPDYSLSHDTSRTIWQTGDPAGVGLGGGWVGRYLAGSYGPTDIPAVNVRDQIAKEFFTTRTSVLAFRRLRNFGFPQDSWDPSDDEFRRAKLVELASEATSSQDGSLGFAGNMTQATFEASQSYPPLHDLYRADRGSWDDAYRGLGTSTARDLLEVAKIVYGVATGQPGVSARLFEVRNGGFDTHSNQGGEETEGTHSRLLREVGDALELFQADLEDMGVADRVVTLVWSEFSRRIRQNDNGTDHGSQGPVFLVGAPVRGGIYGNHPNIGKLDGRGNTPYWQGPLSDDPADDFRSTDFRDVYGTTLKHWFGLSDVEILGSENTPGLLRLDVGDPNFFWTQPNFDLPFL